ncbi:MAG TPA: class I SAM-dependent methyltransferase [Chthonomonadaceae bacterium]|nr:class I SAM-dependent methyltransferase [Chthonomonadaceae bacterium]
MSERHRKIEFGDFQTPLPLAESVCALLKRLGCCPRTVIEPACGEGSFLEAAARVFGTEAAYFGFDINPDYVARASQRLFQSHPKVRTYLGIQDFFTFDWQTFLKDKQTPALFLGNPPWVTNAALGALGAGNLPEKSNLKRLNGLDARTGKANFDISEWMLLKLAEAARGRPFTLAMLCKTGVARKALEYYWHNGLAPAESALYRIPAVEWFGASVDACLFFARFRAELVTDKSARLYSALDSAMPLTRFGLVDGEMVADVDAYRELKSLRGVNYYRWRSGIKHDLAKVMELDIVNGSLRNGFGVEVDVEETHLYPLLKASDVAKGVTTPTRYVLVTQSAVGEETAHLQDTAPKTWDYLARYDALFSERKSSIYRGQPKYCLFGIGPYTFAPYKVAISGLHKEARFTLIPPYQGKPVCVDDTCYFVGSHHAKEAALLHELFYSDLTRRFLKAVIFADSKRPITADILNRLDVKKVAEQLGRDEALSAFLHEGTVETKRQGVLVFEPVERYTP